MLGGGGIGDGGGGGEVDWVRRHVRCFYIEIIGMSSVQRFYAQRDNRIINVPLTGFITNNGTVSGSGPGLNNAAVASLDVRQSRLFTVDTRALTLRASGVWYLVGVVFPQMSPPQYYPGFEVNIIFNVKDTNPPDVPLIFRIQKNPSVPIDYGDETTYIELDNEDYGNTTDTNTVYTYGNRVVTLLSTGETWVIKSSYLNNGPSSNYM